MMRVVRSRHGIAATPVRRGDFSLCMSPIAAFVVKRFQTTSANASTYQSSVSTTSSKRMAVTGAFSYTGRYLTKLLLDAGHSVINLTNHPARPWAMATFTKSELDRVTTISPFDFDVSDDSALSRSLEGVDVLFCTYWVRFAVDGDTHSHAADRVTDLFKLARRRGVRKVVFSSHTQATENSPFAYIAGKAKAAAALRNVCGESNGMSYAIVRPCGIFGDTPEESILLNNAAWILRRCPLMLLPGDGSHRFQPVHVRDMAALMFEVGFEAGSGQERDACGPDAPTAQELFEGLARKCGSFAAVRPLPGAFALSTRTVTTLSKPINWLTGDILLDKDDLDLLCSGLTVADNPADPTIAGRRGLFSWIDEVNQDLGRQYISSIQRYYKK
eukprot:TRINITY_DN51017_c0_g1_i1.p1 TRINITY_DN51017_c0_g1~~TRINITY_DN51017_c0_g1_i1.p1  ORF type:complete len:387 (-),score=35.03 TRINITY_DN51017_c0_g1_i1:123-1283(-)